MHMQVLLLCNKQFSEQIWFTHQIVSTKYLVQVRQLLVPNQRIFVWELPSTQQTSHLLPVSQLLLLILHSF